MLVERIRNTIESLQIAYEEQRISLTISAGICTKGINKQAVSIHEMMKLADNALYQAKHEGRNRIITLVLPSSQD